MVQVNVAAAYADYGTRTYFTRPPKGSDMSQDYQGGDVGPRLRPKRGEETEFSGSVAAPNLIQVELLANPKNGQCYSAGPDGDHVDSRFVMRRRRP